MTCIYNCYPPLPPVCIVDYINFWIVLLHISNLAFFRFLATSCFQANLSESILGEGGESSAKKRKRSKSGGSSGPDQLKPVQLKPDHPANPSSPVQFKRQEQDLVNNRRCSKCDFATDTAAKLAQHYLTCQPKPRSGLTNPPTGPTNPHLGPATLGQADPHFVSQQGPQHYPANPYQDPFQGFSKQQHQQQHQQSFQPLQHRPVQPDEGAYPQNYGSAAHQYGNLHQGFSNPQQNPEWPSYQPNPGWPSNPQGSDQGWSSNPQGSNPGWSSNPDGSNPGWSTNPTNPANPEIRCSCCDYSATSDVDLNMHMIHSHANRHKI